MIRTLHLNTALSAGIAFIVVAFVAQTALTWSGPSQSAPDGNVSPPVHVGIEDQVKDGVLGLNGLAVFGNSILFGDSRYLNFGSLSGEEGYGMRDSAGTLEFKNDNGTWRSLDTIIGDYLTLNNFLPGGGGEGGSFTTTVYEETHAGGLGKSYTCPAGQYVLSASTIQVPGGNLVCNTNIATDKRTVTYNGCQVVSGQNYLTRVICGGGSSTTGGARASDCTRITAEVRGTSLPDCSGDQSGGYFCGYGAVTSCPAGKTLVDFGVYNARGGGDMAGHDFQYHSCEKSGEGVRAYLLVGERNANYVTQCSGLCVPN